MSELWFIAYTCVRYGRNVYQSCDIIDKHPLRWLAERPGDNSEEYVLNFFVPADPLLTEAERGAVGRSVQVGRLD